jgi:hypothetical protein
MVNYIKAGLLSNIAQQILSLRETTLDGGAQVGNLTISTFQVEDQCHAKGQPRGIRKPHSLAFEGRDTKITTLTAAFSCQMSLTHTYDEQRKLYSEKSVCLQTVFRKPTQNFGIHITQPLIFWRHFLRGLELQSSVAQRLEE